MTHEPFDLAHRDPRTTRPGGSPLTPGQVGVAGVGDNYPVSRPPLFPPQRTDHQSLPGHQPSVNFPPLSGHLT